MYNSTYSVVGGVMIGFYVSDLIARTKDVDGLVDFLNPGGFMIFMIAISIGIIRFAMRRARGLFTRLFGFSGMIITCGGAVFTAWNIDQTRGAFLVSAGLFFFFLEDLLNWSADFDNRPKALDKSRALTEAAEAANLDHPASSARSH